ncbi:helix-turn-helix domain-containing protein [Actinocrispum wychmicini]|uniref:Transcriptional regulator with XRE-family HTH domain n=1 Tax=Actinocrispum wychmicini TaxID=1213861 RepID=A0A4R2JQ20_9PSEU|nr:XRE family transcriptional regulator [Actinocrispum wychmicini]TCO61107.1 transcriptional regulator with XRE-family HTH domain [Actinocrispum wychmicini]
MTVTGGQHQMPKEPSVGARIRHERKARKLTLRELAAQCGISVSFLSQLERDLARPSVGTLHNLAEAFGLSMADLLADGDPGSSGWGRAAGRLEQSARYAEVVRADRRKTIIYPGSGIHNELLTPDLGRALQMMWVVIPVGQDTGPEPLSHEGEECGLVIQGRVGVWVGPAGEEEYYELGPGDAIYQLSKHPHRSRNIGDVDVLIVTAITPPSL